MEIIKVQGLKKVYGNDTFQMTALDCQELSIEEGMFTVIVGKSGSGKTTLLNLLGGIDDPTEGEVWVNGVAVYQLSREERTIFRRRTIGFVFQNYNLMPVLNVYENIVLPLRLDGKKTSSKFIQELISSLKLEEKKYHMPEMLSGGEQQRVAIARALAAKPALLLADEPTGNLDSGTGIEVVGYLKTCAWKYNQTIIMVTHDEEIAQMADRIVYVEDGRIRQEKQSGA